MNSTATATATAPEATGASVWLDLVTVAIGQFRTLPFHAVTLETVAVAAQTPLETVLEQFPRQDDLVIATVQVWNAERMAPILPIAERLGAVAFLRAIVEANIADPALMRLLIAMVNIAATPAHPLAPLLRDQWIAFHAIVQRALTNDLRAGREPATMEPAHGAEQLIALYEGLQLQSMMRPHMRLLDSYDRAVTRLRRGWSEEYLPPAWAV